MRVILIAAPSSHDFWSPLPLEECIVFSPDSALVPQISDRQNLVHENSLEGDMSYESYSFVVELGRTCWTYGIVAPPARFAD